MDPTTLVHLVTPVLPWVLIASGLGTVGSLIFGALLLQGLRVPPVAAGAVVGLPVLVALGLSVWALSGQAADGDAALRAVAVPVVLRLMLPMFVGVPGCIALVLGAGVAARRAPRRFWAAGVAAALAMIVPALVFYSGVVIEDPTFSTMRAVMYLGIGATAAVAMLAGDPQGGTGPEGAGWAGIVFALLVAVGETSGRAMAEMQALLGLGAVPPADRAEVVRVFVDQVVLAQQPWAWGAFGIAAGVAILGAVAAPWERKRAGGSLLALLWLLAGLGLLLAGNPPSEMLVKAIP